MRGQDSAGMHLSVDEGPTQAGGTLGFLVTGATQGLGVWEYPAVLARPAAWDREERWGDRVGQEAEESKQTVSDCDERKPSRMRGFVRRN